MVTDREWDRYGKHDYGYNRIKRNFMFEKQCSKTIYDKL